jgi:hypothetical protein
LVQSGCGRTKKREKGEVVRNKSRLVAQGFSQKEGIDYEEIFVSYGPPWAHYLGGYQDRLLGGPLGLPGLRCTAPDGVKHKDYRGEILG